MPLNYTETQAENKTATGVRVTDIIHNLDAGSYSVKYVKLYSDSSESEHLCYRWSGADYTALMAKDASYYATSKQKIYDELALALSLPSGTVS